MEPDTLNQMFQMHIKECDGRDRRNTDAINEIKGMFKGIWEAQDKMSGNITSLQNRGAILLGGLIVLGKAFDYYIAWFHK